MKHSDQHVQGDGDKGKEEDEANSDRDESNSEDKKSSAGATESKDLSAILSWPENGDLSRQVPILISASPSMAKQCAPVLKPQ